MRRFAQSKTPYGEEDDGAAEGDAGRALPVVFGGGAGTGRPGRAWLGFAFDAVVVADGNAAASIGFGGAASALAFAAASMRASSAACAARAAIASANGSGRGVLRRMPK